MLEVVLSKCLISVNEEDTVRDLANLCIAFLQTLAAKEGSWAWEMGAGTNTAKCSAAEAKLHPLDHSSTLRLARLTRPVNSLLGPLLSMWDGPKRKEREKRGSWHLSHACLPGMGLAHSSEHGHGSWQVALLASEICWIHYLLA